MSNPRPMVRTRRAGGVTQALEFYAKAYKDANEGRDCRWVYNPKQKPELSNVQSRQAEGYSIVKIGELKLDAMPEGFSKAGDAVQIADLVLMGISAPARQQLLMERAGDAKEAALSIDRKYYDAIEEMKIPGAQEVHRSKPIGRSIIEERDFQYDVQQRTGGE